MTIHVLIVNYNSSPDLRQCLESLSDGYEVLVLENGSPGPEPEQCREVVASYRQAKMIESPRNLGFGAGVNRLTRELQGSDDDLIWILNPDTVLTPSAGQAMLAAVDRNRSPALYSPRLFYVDITTGAMKNWYVGGSIDARRGISNHADIGQPFNDSFGEDRRTTFITGAAIMARLGDWRELGGFREDLFLYWEDAELSLRARNAGFDLIVVANAVVMHNEGGSSRNGSSGRSELYYYYLARNRLIVCGSNARERWSLLAGRGIAGTVKQVAIAIFREHESRWSKVRAVLFGCLDGLRGRTGRRSVGSVSS